MFRSILISNSYAHVVDVYGRHHDIFGLRATFLWMLLFCGDISPCIKYLEPQAYVNY